MSERSACIRISVEGEQAIQEKLAKHRPGIDISVYEVTPSRNPKSRRLLFDLITSIAHERVSPTDAEEWQEFCNKGGKLQLMVNSSMFAVFDVPPEEM